MYTTLISVDEFRRLQASGARLMVFDCSFDLANPAAGEEAYREGHIPGALYANLDTNLSDMSDAGTAASGGRHPLPSRENFALWLSSVGFANDMQAVVYDRNNGNYCGRMWWMLKWCGHDAVAVLDGGLKAWQESGGEVTDREEVAHFQSNFQLGPELRSLATTADVLASLKKNDRTIVDARSGPRFRGEVEPLDPVAGHIPGAFNRPSTENIGPDGRFKPAAQLRAEFEKVLAGRDPSTVVHHCGSGVSAVPNIIAMEVAGLGPTSLYAGSWSEWCSDPSRPVAKGA